MPHTVSEMDNGSCKNMVSNLPLLFAGGYPTSLERITETQLEKFIPFMVQCSLGYIHIPTLEEYSEPEWWPGDLEFIVPFCRPKAFRGNWLEKMRELVVICYSFHKCVFLLRFCTDLASYAPATLRFINNYNSTTSLYQRHTRKLLVTFRNENMLYDQAQQITGRKCLLPKQINSQQSDLHEQMVEPAFFDIYLCDDCDAELYSYDAYVEHEKVCLNRRVVQEESEDDDVIYCGSEVLPTPMQPDEVPVYSAQNMSSFLMNFSLFNKNNPLALRKIGSNIDTSDQTINILDGSPEKLRRLPRRTRGIITLSKCTSIPLSSPCGQFLLKSNKTVMSIDYQIERLERLERFCFAPALIKDGMLVTNRPKWLNAGRINTNLAVSYKRGPDELERYHSYKFPRRQFSSACKMRNFQFYNKLLINRCKPCAIKLQRLTAQEIENRNIDIRLQHLNITKARASIEASPDAQIKTIHVVVDCIDLCSSDEDEPKVNINQNGCIISEDSTVVERLTADESQKLLTTDIIANTTSLTNPTEINSSHIASKKSVAHCTFQPLTPSLHLFSSAQNVNPAMSPSHAHPSSMNSQLQSSLCISDEANDNDIILSNMENLTEVKENRVNDWLNDAAISTENLAHMPQSHLVITSATSVIKNSSGIAVPKTLPSLMKLGKSPSPTSKDIVIRQRTITKVDLS